MTICLGELILSDTVDDRNRGPYTIIESTAVDGNVADVYGEFPEESAANARAIVDGINELATLCAEVARLTAELAAAREALECTFNWAMTDANELGGGFDIFAEEIVPMIGKVLGRE